MITFAIGDLHGCAAQLTALLDQCYRFADGKPHKFIFLGNYIDQGLDSQSVVQTLMDLQAADPDRVIALSGSHEDLLVDARSSEGMARWLVQGGSATLRSYGVTSPKGIPVDHRAWLANLPLTHDDGQRLFVHAGIRPGIPLADQTRDNLLTIGKDFIGSITDHGRLIVHGLTRRRDGRPESLPNRVNLHTGAGSGGPLTAAVFVESKRMPVKYFQAGPSEPSPA